MSTVNATRCRQNDSRDRAGREEGKIDGPEILKGATSVRSLNNSIMN